MNTNINSDNYEAYLLDYMEGNLSPDETKQLKAFVATQGLDWEELTEELPHLKAPQIVFQDKDRLKSKSLSLPKGRSNNKPALVPLYAKIASAAAAAGLLLTIGLWPERQHSYVEPVAELKPIPTERLITSSEPLTLPKRTVLFLPTQPVTKDSRLDTPLLAELSPKSISSLPTPQSFEEPDFSLTAYRISTDLAFAQTRNYSEYEEEDFEGDLSLIGKGLMMLTEGKHSSFASLINAGLGQAKQKATETATDIALVAYHRAEDSFEEAREQWNEKHGE